MQNKYQNKYRISSARLKSWDYSTNGAYFITICTQNRKHFFGTIQKGIIQLSEIGKLAEQYWLEIPNHFSFIQLGNFVIMPNHVHGIVIINCIPNPVETRFIASKNIKTTDETTDDICNETRLIASLQGNVGGFSGDKNPMVNDNLSKIIRWYKGRCSFESRKINSNFGWQSRFHDHIIRNSKSFDRIQNYIFENPLKWEEDTFYK